MNFNNFNSKTAKKIFSHFLIWSDLNEVSNALGYKVISPSASASRVKFYFNMMNETFLLEKGFREKKAKRRTNNSKKLHEYIRKKSPCYRIDLSRLLFEYIKSESDRIEEDSKIKEFRKNGLSQVRELLSDKESRSIFIYFYNEKEEIKVFLQKIIDALYFIIDEFPKLEADQFSKKSQLGEPFFSMKYDMKKSLFEKLKTSHSLRYMIIALNSIELARFNLNHAMRQISFNSFSFSFVKIPKHQV